MSLSTALEPQDRVALLLRTLDEARVAWDARSSGGGASLMPTMYGEGSYAELERCLILMREGGEDVLLDPATGKATLGDGGFVVSVMRAPQRRLWWHVCQRYRWGVERVLLVHVRKRAGTFDYLMPPNTELVAGGAAVGESRARVRAYCWSEDVDDWLVAKGLEVLTSLMHGGRSEQIWLPDSLFRRALGLPPRDEIEQSELAAA